jgi:phosphatidylglycerol:prolipoprotein diacylglycerol transferase
MNFPLEIGFANYKISSHLFFESLAFFIGFRFFLYLRKKKTDTISESNRISILIAAIFGAFFFSRLIGSLENPLEFYQSEQKLLYFYQNKTIIGGLLGGLLFVELIKLKLKVNKSSGDLFTYPLILAMIIGRIGCFTTGVYENTYGIITNSIFGLDLGDGNLRHPVALYEIFFLILLTFFLKKLENKNKLLDGYRFQIFLMLYLLFRFNLDFIKPRIVLFFNIGSIQIVCFLGLIYYRKIIYKLFFLNKGLYEYK